MLGGMSGFEPGSGDYACASPSLDIRINEPFLDVKTMSSDKTDLEERSSDGVLSHSSTPHWQSDERSRETVLSTSTPDLSFTASSSPCRFASRDSPSLYTASPGRLRYRNVAPPFESNSGHAFFLHRLDHLLQQAADQRYQNRTSEDTMRIHPDLCEGAAGPVSQIVSMAHDEVPVSALGPIESDSRFSALPIRKLQRSLSLATASYEAGCDSTRNKRKVDAAIDEGHKTLAASLIHDSVPSDCYLSASDGASSTSSRCPDVPYPSFKKRRRLSSGLSHLSVVSPRADSTVVSDTNLIRSEPSSVGKNRGSHFSAARYASKGVQYPSPSPTLSQDEQIFEDAVSSHSRSTESDCSYPPTEIATPPLDFSPVPILDVQDFPETCIPRVFYSSNDAAEARIRSLLRKETHYCQSQGLDALVEPDLAFQDTLIPEVIAWILTVEPPLGSPTALWIRGRVYSHDLHEQLTVHHDSRFFAVLIFSLFFFVRVRDSKVSKEVDQPDMRKALKRERSMAIWDYAVAAIALAVKIHRDSYAPLKPIFGHHFVALAHHEMCPEDLELAQRTLLKHFSYNLGMPTPQEFLDELPIALPTLRQAVESEHAWQDVLGETWKQLIAAAHWPSMLRFPVSLLTATALSHAIQQVVHRRRALLEAIKATEHAECACDCHHMKLVAPGRFPQIAVPEHESSNAELGILHPTSAVLEDIREVLGLSVGKTEECEEWFALVRAASEKPLHSKYFRGIST